LCEAIAAFEGVPKSRIPHFDKRVSGHKDTVVGLDKLLLVPGNLLLDKLLLVPGDLLLDKLLLVPGDLLLVPGDLLLVPVNRSCVLRNRKPVY